MIYTNPGSAVKDVAAVYYNTGSAVKEVQAIWTNVSGTLYQVWPVAHTAYDGSTFKGALKDGLISGIDVYCMLLPTDTATTRTIYMDGDQFSGTANKTCTSGVAEVKLYDTNNVGGGWRYKAWKTRGLVNLSLYDSITLTYEVTDSRFVSSASFRGICLVNSAGNSASFVEANSNGVCDVSGKTGLWYLVFSFAIYLNSTTNIYDKYCNGKITRIDFA